MEEYISHVDYKKMMENFKKGTPKKMLKENTVGQHFNLDVTSKRGDGSVQKYQLKNVKLVNANERVFEKPDGTTVVLSPSDTYTSTKVEEGNAFTAGLAKAKKGQEFKIGDKAVKDTSNYDASMEEASYTDNYEGSWGYREGKVKESHQGNDQWYEEFQTAISAMGLAGEAEARVMKALDHTDPLTQYGSMTAPEAARDFVSDLGIVSADDYDDYDADYEEPRDDFDMAGGDFNDGEFWENEVKKLQEIAGVGPQDDGPEDDNDEERKKRADKEEEEDTEAENAERDAVDEEAHADGSHMRDPDTAAKTVAEKHGAELKPLYDKYQAAYEQYIKDINNKELSKAYSALVKEFQNNAINWCGHEMLEAGMKRVQVNNLLSGYGYFEDWLSDYITAIGKELGGASEKEKAMYANTDPNIADPINEGSDYNKIIPALKAKGVKYGMPEKEIIKAMAEVMKQEAGYTDKEIRYYLGYEEDFIPDLLQALKDSDMEEGLHMPPLQATGPTVGMTEDQAPFGMSVLSPDERKQLKEFIDSYKTIKAEISKLLEKAGKSGKIIEGVKDDEAVPAARPAHYNEPTKTPKHNPSNLGGNRTGLVMTKAEMWEGEESGTIADSLGEKLHSTFSKVTDMAIKQLVADGWDEDQAISFLQAEIEEKGKEATMSQYDM
jgi:hypothetical protein